MITIKRFFGLFKRWFLFLTVGTNIYRYLMAGERVKAGDLTKTYKGDWEEVIMGGWIHSLDARPVRRHWRKL